MTITKSYAAAAAKLEYYHDNTWVVADWPRVKVDKITKVTLPGFSTALISATYGYGVSFDNDVYAPEPELRKNETSPEILKGTWIKISCYETETEWNDLNTGEAISPSSPSQTNNTIATNLPTEIPSESTPEYKVIFFGIIYDENVSYSNNGTQVNYSAYDIAGFMSTQKFAYMQQLIPDTSVTQTLFNCTNFTTLNYSSKNGLIGNKYKKRDITETINHPLFNDKLWKLQPLYDWSDENANFITDDEETKLWNAYDVVQLVIDYLNEYYYQFNDTFGVTFTLEDTANIKTIDDISIDLKKNSMLQVLSHAVSRGKGLTGHWEYITGDGNIEIKLIIESSFDQDTGEITKNTNIFDYTDNNGFPIRHYLTNPKRNINETYNYQHIIIRTKPTAIVGTFSPRTNLRPQWGNTTLPTDIQFDDYDGMYDFVYTRYTIDPLLDIYDDTLQLSNAKKTMCVELTSSSNIDFAPKYRRFTFPDEILMAKNIPIKPADYDDVNWEENKVKDSKQPYTYNEKDGMQPMFFIVEPDTKLHTIFECRVLAGEKNTLKIQPTDDIYDQQYFRDVSRRNKLNVTCMVENCQPFEWKFVNLDTYDPTAPQTTKELVLNFTPVVILPDTKLITKDADAPEFGVAKWYNANTTENPKLCNTFRSVDSSNTLQEQLIWDYVNSVYFYMIKEKNMMYWDINHVDIFHDSMLGGVMKTMEVPEITDYDIEESRVLTTNNTKAINTNTVVTRIEYDFNKQSTSYATEWFDLEVI